MVAPVMEVHTVREEVEFGFAQRAVNVDKIILIERRFG